MAVTAGLARVQCTVHVLSSRVLCGLRGVAASGGLRVALLRIGTLCGCTWLIGDYMRLHIIIINVGKKLAREKGEVTDTVATCSQVGEVAVAVQPEGDHLCLL